MQTPIAPLSQLIVVDDDLLYTRLVELVLKSLKFTGEVRIFNHPTDLMPFLLAPPAIPHQPIRRLALVDLSMPKLNGVSLLKMVRADPHTKSTPVIIMSGGMDNREVQDAFLQGANACMNKPDELDAFFLVFEKLLQYWFSASLLPIC